MTGPSAVGERRRLCGDGERDERVDMVETEVVEYELDRERFLSRRRSSMSSAERLRRRVATLFSSVKFFLKEWLAALSLLEMRLCILG